MLIALLAASSIALSADIAAVAALPGEPHIVSAAAMVGEERIPTLENGSAYETSRKRRLVLVGPRDGSGNSETASQVVEAVRWFKTRAPAALRAQWTVAALPDFRRGGSAIMLDHWIAFQAPDLVVNIGDERGGWLDHFFTDALRTAEGLDAWVAPMRRVACDDRFPQAMTDLLQQSSWLSPTLTSTKTNAPPTTIRDGVRARVERDPLAIARVLANKYPQQPAISYIPAVAWMNMLRLAEITHETGWRNKVVEQTRTWAFGDTPLFGAQTPLTAIAGTMIFAEMKDAERSRALMEQPARLAAALKDDGTYANGRGWTDDMFMATAVLVRTAQLDLAARKLLDYAARLQRRDGLFVHGTDGPWTWGRGNGFAAFGAMEALSAMPVDYPARAAVLGLFRRQMAALVKAQAPDGMWNEIVNEPGSYREVTATAMIFSAMARGIRLGWLDRSYAPVAERAWRALAAHVAGDGSLVDVCESTGAGPTKEYYLTRKAITGNDDRGGAMALMAAIEQYELKNLRSRK
jgi:rhamnogalacturonyl hydrolase YesR